MFALRGLRPAAKQSKRLMRDPAQMQQKRFAGGDDDSASRVNWWDAPTNPDIWQKHHLAWWTIAIYGSVYWLVAGGKKKDPATETKA